MSGKRSEFLQRGIVVAEIMASEEAESLDEDGDELGRILGVQRGAQGRSRGDDGKVVGDRVGGQSGQQHEGKGRRSSGK